MGERGLMVAHLGTKNWIISFCSLSLSFSKRPMYKKSQFHHLMAKCDIFLQLNLPRHWCPSMQNGENRTTYLTGFSWGLNQFIFIKQLEQCLVHSERSMHIWKIHFEKIVMLHQIRQSELKSNAGSLCPGIWCSLSYRGGLSGAHASQGSASKLNQARQWNAQAPGRPFAFTAQHAAILRNEVSGLQKFPPKKWTLKTGSLHTCLIYLNFNLAF